MQSKSRTTIIFLDKEYNQKLTNTNLLIYGHNNIGSGKEEFDDYIIKSKSLSLYKVDTSAEYGELLMPLSTCEYSGLN